MSRMESNLAEKFYALINDIPSKNWWRFIRILGLPENDIDEVSYEEDDLTEQKYQMLTRWKNYFGYKVEESKVIECMNTAKNEVLCNANPEILNRVLWGGLLENRLIAKKFYAVMERIEREKRKMFAITKLNLPEHEASAIAANYNKDVDEQCYQMFLAWKRRAKIRSYHEVNEAIEKFYDEFTGQPRDARPGVIRTGEAPNQPTGDVGIANDLQPQGLQPPSSDEVTNTGSFSYVM